MKFFVTADLHLRADKPRCRLDDNWELFQDRCLEFISDQAAELNVPLVIVGDIFNTPVVPPRILNSFLFHMRKVKKGVYFLLGNHDLPYHSFSNVENCSGGVLWNLVNSGGVFKNLDEIGQWAMFGEDIRGKETGLLFLHTLTFPSAKDIPPNVEAFTASELLQKYPKAEYIFTGDMHKKFVHYSLDNRKVINPGCLNRQSANEIDYDCSIYFIDTEEGIIQDIIVFDNSEMVTDEYLKREEEREDRISAFIEGIQSGKKVSLSFLDNLDAHIQENKYSDSTKNMIKRLMEESK